MRVTRNYMNSMLNGNNGLNGTTSLLQRALSRSKKTRSSNRASLLMNTVNNKNNIYTGAIRGSADTQKLYYNMKYHAGQVTDYADQLTDKSDKSIFAKAKESGETAQIVAAVKGFVGQYNSMMDNLQDSGSRTDNTFVAQFNSIANMSSSELAACGITRKSDGTLAVDDEKLEKADIDTLEKAWNGSSSFAGRVAIWTNSVESSAERNMQAQASSSYSDLFSNYGSRGNYFNFFR